MILNHAAIGNGRVLALVGPDSAVDWLCMPRFDSPSVFGRLLDQQEGGTFQFLPEEGEINGEQSYIRNTNVSRIVFTNGDSRWEVVDFAPRTPDGLDVRAPLVFARLVRPLAGSPVLRVRFDPRPDYARREVELREGANGVVICNATEFALTSNLPAAYIVSGGAFVLDQPYFFLFSYEPLASDEPLGHSATLHDVQRALELTIVGWRNWAKTLALPSFHAERVLRSALCLKLHASEDTGAIIAATTTSVPEAMHTERTWDYRYCWLRDSAFVVEAFRALGHLNEGERFIRYLRNVVEAGPLQPLYGIGGERELEEKFLEHLAGFRGNGFVRIGNAAYSQRQHDLMGEMLLCIDALLRDPRLVVDDEHQYWPLVKRLVEQAIELAPVPDTSIWEFRSYLRHYTFSRAMCWAAIDRGRAIATRLGYTEQAVEWRAAADAERALLLDRGYNTDHGFFTQALDGRMPDASNLLLPTIGLVDAQDIRFQRTLDAYRELLVENGLMLRYRNEDDFGETTSAFTICSFWWSVALAQAGRLDESMEVFERVSAFANPLGLMSEDIDPANGDLLGNFPQAYTHVGLIHSATTIGRLFDQGHGAAGRWV